MRGNWGNVDPAKIPTNSKPPFETSMERGRYAQVVSLVKSGNMDVNEFYTFLKPDLAWYNGNFFSTFPPAVAVLAAPFYIFGSIMNLGQVFTYSVSALFSIFTAYIIYLTCKKHCLSQTSTFLSLVVFTLGSVTWAYSASFSAHTVSSFIFALGMYFLLKFSSENQIKWQELFIVGLLFGACFLVDYPNIATFAPIFVFILVRSLLKIEAVNNETHLVFNLKNPALVLLGFGLVFSVFIAYNLYYFQKPIAFTNTYSVKFLEISGIDVANYKLTNEIFKDRKYENRFSLEQALSGTATLLVSEDRGLIMFAPVFLLSLLGIVISYRRFKWWSLVLIGSVAINVIVYGSYDDPWGGWAFGPRYLIVILPFLTVLVGLANDFLVQRFGVVARVASYILASIGGLISLLGALTTNAVPPSIEVAKTNIPSNYLYNWRYLNNDGVSSFIYKAFLETWLEPTYYFFILSILLLIGFGIIIFGTKPTNPNSNN